LVFLERINAEAKKIIRSSLIIFHIL